MSDAQKKQYRRAIWVEWRKIVSRKKLTSYEYKLIDGYFADGVPVEVIIRAIKQACERARARGTVVYSLGFIGNDILGIQRQRASLHVGSGNDGRRSTVDGQSSEEAWREAARYAIEEIAEETPDPERSAMYREMLRDLPGMSRAEAEERYRAITRKDR